MHCSACSTAIQEALGRMPGVISADVNLLTESANVEYKLGGNYAAVEAQIVQQIEDCGFEATVSTECPFDSELPGRVKLASVMPLHVLEKGTKSVKRSKCIELSKLWHRSEVRHVHAGG